MKHHFVTVSRNINFGRPRLRASNIGTAAITDRFKAGEALSDLALDYGIPESEVLEAIRFELRARAK